MWILLVLLCFFSWADLVDGFIAHGSSGGCVLKLPFRQALAPPAPPHWKGIGRLRSSVETPSTTSPISGSDNQNDTTTSLGAWVPVGSVSSLRGITPFRVEIMGQNFVVWNNHASKKQKNTIEERWSVLLDECPHRLVPLSLGRIDPETNCLECPYHGWQFGTNGTLTKLPQLEETRSLSSLQSQGSATSFPVHLTGDLIWTFLPSSFHGELFPQTLLPEDYFPGVAEDMQNPAATYSSHEMPASMDITVENGIDPSHFPFSHHGVISQRSDAAPMPDMKCVTSNFTHLDIYASYLRNGEPRERLYSFQRPFLLCTQERDGEDQWKHASKFFIVPVREGRCRIVTSVQKLSKPWFPKWLTHVFVTRLFVGDLFLHDSERSRQNPQGRAYLQPTSSDESARAWQRWHTKYGFSKSPPHTFRSASYSNLSILSRKEQEDQWLTHTYSCAQCRTALKRSRIARLASGTGGLLLAAFLIGKQNRPIQAAIAAAAGLSISWVTSKIVKFHEGTIRPSDASDRGWSMYV